jgi:eukaryotic-like serine/threonine-protein kinase
MPRGRRIIDDGFVVERTSGARRRAAMAGPGTETRVIADLRLAPEVDPCAGLDPVSSWAGIGLELPQPSLGDPVGRYTVLELLGRGGMGAVYKAYDPQLDRNVALKLLRRVARDDELGAEHRLLREAQTLAQLQHPNVVAVFDAGLTERGVFIAMELFEGRTLREWLDERPREVSEILAVFRAAGRGLAAAHDAGFVHRDFKPANVLVGHDGSVRVLDFGIASLMDPHADEPTSVSPWGVARRSRAVDWRSSPRPDAGPTDGGLIMGTPSFMAPEQLTGRRADHRSDQFAFCVCLHVALYGRSPVMGHTFEERREHLARGQVLDERVLLAEPSVGVVPTRVRRAIMRGLSTAPAARFASMHALIAALEPGARRWPAVLAGLMLLVGFGAGALVFPAAIDPCARSRLHDYAAGWAEVYDDSCRARSVTHPQRERLPGLRTRCLPGSRREGVRPAAPEDPGLREEIAARLAAHASDGKGADAPR